MKNIGDERQPDQKINKFISVVNSIQILVRTKKMGTLRKCLKIPIL
jgi:hypothetical protein